ncbi:Ig-like domain-containing protein [Streptomyces sp. ISL-90]|nr:Ig-like domain-containing protein [Streptomyces sp. ISL-90]
MATVLGAGLAGATALPAAAAVPEPDLHYTMDAITGGVVTDASGHGRDGTVSGNASIIADGEASALDLAGGASGGFVSLPRTVLEGAIDLTVSTRLRWDGAGGPWQWAYALGTDTSRYLFSTPSNDAGVLRTAITSNFAGAEAKVTGYQPLAAGEWVTLTVVLDTAADRLTTYVDGVAVATATTTVSAGELLTAGATRAGYIGKSFYPDPLFDGAVDDFTIYRAALDGAQVAELAGGELPALTGLQTESFDLRTTVGTAPALPQTVRATFADGYDRDVPITWDAVPAEAYADRGEFSVSGLAAGLAVTAKVTVIREGELQVDLATDTGAFHGGASGTLYGLYGPGLPSANLIEGMNLRTVSTKAQDGPQHPGADALEVVKPLADATGGDVYVYMTDIHRGFPYEWPGSTAAEKIALFKEKITAQVQQVATLPEELQHRVVFVPFNEPEGNMFGTGQWSANRTNWLSNPALYFQTWDEVHALIRGILPDARIAGPNTSVLYGQVKGFLEHTLDAGTLPDVITWHELSHPEAVRSSVAVYRGWETELFAGTPYEGTQLPININEYAFNYHTSVPGQMIQWIAAIEESKVDADIAYWNIDGNLSDSAVQANRANGQWWLYNAYGSMTGHTVEVSPPYPGQNYTVQAVATLDEEKRQARAILGGGNGVAHLAFDNVPSAVFGETVHAFVREIPWTGQIGDSAQPAVVAELDLEVKGGAVELAFTGDGLPQLKESSAYEVVLTPAGPATPTAQQPKLWEGSFEAEAAVYTGSGYSKNGPEGSPSNVSKFYTSGGYNVGGLRTGSNGVLDFTVEVPQDGRYDLSVFANSQNTFSLIADRGPTNVFLRVDGAQEQEVLLPLGYKWVVWDHADTTVELTAGTHTISLAARSLDGTRVTQGDAIVDRITLALPNPDAAASVYEAELADVEGADLRYELPAKYSASGVSGAGVAELGETESVTFWVYSKADAESTLRFDGVGVGSAALAVNEIALGKVVDGDEVAVSLSGGVNKVVLSGTKGKPFLLDRLVVDPGSSSLAESEYEAEAAELDGSAAIVDLSNAAGGKAVDGIGGDPGNGNTLSFDVTVEEAGTYAMRVRYANPEQSPASHYNPDPMARRADLTINGGDATSVLFPHSFHRNNFWELTVVVELEAGANTIEFASEEAPNFDGQTLASETWPDVPLRSRWAPIVDRITIAEFSSR